MDQPGQHGTSEAVADAGAGMPLEASRPRSAWLWLWVALALLPLGYLVFDLAVFAADVPLWDSWEFVPLLEKNAATGVVWQDFWAQHNQHRLVFPRLTLLGLASASHYALSWEMTFQVLQALACYLVLAYAAVSLLEKVCKKRSFEVLAFLSLLVFSQTQWENWVCGWQVQIWMSVAASTCGLVLLARPPFSRARLAGALGLGVVATYSFGSGVLFWPIAVASIWATRERPAAVRQGAILLVTAALVLGAYRYGYRENSDPYSWVGRTWGPGTFAAYVLKFLGAAIATGDQGAAIAVGVLGLALLVLLPAALVRRGAATFAELAPFVAIAGCAVLAAFLTGIGRAGYGSKMAFQASRYVTLSTPFWCTHVVLLLAIARAPAKAFHLLERRAAALVLAFVVALAIYGEHEKAKTFREHSALFQEARDVVLGKAPLDLAKLHEIYTPALVDARTGLPTPAFGRLWHRIEWLREHHLSTFRP